MSRTQAHRQAELITPLGVDDLLFFRMVANEGVSRLFDYDLVVLSENENIDLDKLVGQHSHVELELPHGDTRYFCGHVTRFSFIGFHGNLAKYQVRLRPWLWFLTRAMNNRIFQNETVPNIIKAVCLEHGFTDIDDRLTANYRDREFCVQYRESDFAFLSRLMEEEGIYYYFTHAAGKHELVFADSISAHEPYGDYAVVPWFPPDEHDHRERDHLDHWQVSKAVRTGKYTLRDYNFETPKADLEVRSQLIRDIEHAAYERYEYPGEYRGLDDGADYVRVRMEEAQADFETLRGHGNARGLQPGFLFELEGFPRDDQNREYLILQVTHDITQDAYDTQSDRAGNETNYSCSVEALPASEVFRPARVTRKPLVYGPQTAVVVGQDGAEIHTDQHGRIKVQFHWDRQGENNDNSSCWVRVSQAWAGKKFGIQFLPRVGHEVIVEFLEGDPDRPIVTGSVYNADNKPPYNLPAHATQSGIKTRSSSGGLQENFNEIRFEDQKDSEQIYIHAEKDMDIVVENDMDTTIEANRSVSVGSQVNVHKDSLTVSGDRNKVVAGKETVAIRKDLDETIDGNWDLLVKGQADIEITKGAHLTFPEGKLEITADHGVEIHDSHLTIHSGDLVLKSGKVKQESKSSENISGSDWEVVGASFGLTGAGLAITGSDNSITALELGATGVSIGVSGVSVDFAGVAVAASILDVDYKVFALGNEGIKLGKKEVELTQAEIKILKHVFFMNG
jgi:type VI secretion system secreted protein VgrG